MKQIEQIETKDEEFTYMEECKVDAETDLANQQGYKKSSAATSDHQLFVNF